MANDGLTVAVASVVVMFGMPPVSVFVAVELLVAVGGKGRDSRL